MFLANSLKEKLKKNYVESDTDSIGQAKYSYQKQPKNPKVLLKFREGEDGAEGTLIPDNKFTTQKLQSLDKNEWESTFTIDKLRSEWKTRVNLDFESSFKKFSDDFVLPGVITSKSYIQNLIDPDRLELKPRVWNISNNAGEKIKPELRKKIFEIGSGLTDFKAVKIKENPVEEGVDSRDHLKIDDQIWNVSNQVVRSELKNQDNEKLKKAKSNTNRYWKENDELRTNEQPFPISEDKKRIEVIRYFKKYRTPYEKTADYYKTMEKIKSMTFIERENAEQKVKYRYPGAVKYPEKVNSLVLKELYNTYKDKYNEMTGKLSKDELKKRQRDKDRFKWTDIDLVNKILAINTLTKSNSSDQLPDDSRIPNCNFSQENNNKLTIQSNQYLLPLVSKGREIKLEEEKIKDRLEEEFKKRRKRELLLNPTGLKKNITLDKFESKYPKKELSKDNEKVKILKNILPYDKPQKKFATISSTDQNYSNTISYMNNISTKSHCGTHFLEAYDKIANKEMRRIQSLEKRNKKELHFEYSHPGTYRSFTFVENVWTDHPENPDLPGENLQKKITNSFWSCCMNSDKNSRGCQKTFTKNYRWMYYP